jgi:hypothetical protein
MFLPGCLGSSVLDLTRRASARTEAVEVVAEVEIDRSSSSDGAEQSFHL